MMVGLYSINLRVMSGANVSLLRETTIFNEVAGFLGLSSGSLIVSITVALVFGVIVFLILNWFLRTEIGLALRATGDNEQMVRALGADTDKNIMLGCSISNGLVALAGAVVSFFIILGGYELIRESSKVMHGEDPKLEKFSKFLESHLKILPHRGVFVSLWLFNLQEMTQEENLKRIKKGFGKHFPVKLEDKDYRSIYKKLESEELVEKTSEGELSVTDKGKKELKILAKEQPAYLPWLHREVALSPRKIDWFVEGL